MPFPTKEWEPNTSCVCSSPLVAAVAFTTSHWGPKDSLLLPLGMVPLWHSLNTLPVYITVLLLCANMKLRKWVLLWHRSWNPYTHLALNSFLLLPEAEDVKTFVYKRPEISKEGKKNKQLYMKKIQFQTRHKWRVWLKKKKWKDNKFQSDLVLFLKTAWKQILKHLTIPYSLGWGFFPLDFQRLRFRNAQPIDQAFFEQGSDP